MYGYLKKTEKSPRVRYRLNGIRKHLLLGLILLFPEAFHIFPVELWFAECQIDASYNISDTGSFLLTGYYFVKALHSNPYPRIEVICNIFLSTCL